MMNNNMTHEQVWNECFTQFKKLDGLTQQILRRSAVQHLVDRGFEEVGSSDTNHSLFGMWEAANGDWQKAIMHEVDARVR
jgi:hypothetical protein